MQIQIFHTLTSENGLLNLTNIITYFEPDLIGIRSLCRFKEKMKNIVEFIKKIAPMITTIADGSYPTVSHNEVLENMAVDIVIIGEGEDTFLEIIDYWKNQNDIP